MMRKLLLGIIIGSASISSYATVSQADAILIYKRLITSNGFTRVPALVFTGSTQINASCSSNGRLVITAGMLNHLQNKDELASILGHELGHCMKNDYRNELQADSVGAAYMGKAGYDVCNGLQALKRMNRPNSGTHPASIERYRRLCQ